MHKPQYLTHNVVRRIGISKSKLYRKKFARENRYLNILILLESIDTQKYSTAYSNDFKISKIISWFEELTFYLIAEQTFSSLNAISSQLSCFNLYNKHIVIYNGKTTVFKTLGCLLRNNLFIVMEGRNSSLTLLYQGLPKQYQVTPINRV